MKRFMRIISVIAIGTSLILSAASAVSLPSTRFYGDAGFTDVPDDWSLPYIRDCYELGLMSGQGHGLFAPSLSVSVAEGITVAARVHNLQQSGTGEFPAGEFWYSGAVRYAQENGISYEDEFSDFTSPITRRQLAGLLAKALPAEEYSPINSVAFLPDVSWEEPYGEEIFSLYVAGILIGTDAYGTFYPDTPITRAELSAILCRLVRPETRKSFSLLPSERSAEGLSLLYFYATWCEPCRMLTPTIDQLAARYQPEGLLIQRIDVDKQTALTNLYQVNSYPTVVFLRNGQEVHRQVGGLSFDDYCALISDWR